MCTVDTYGDIYTVNIYRHAIGIVTSVTQKNIPCEVVYYYCAWYVFLRDVIGIGYRYFYL